MDLLRDKYSLIPNYIDGDVDEHNCVDDKHDQNRSIKPKEFVQFPKEQAGPK